MKKIVPVIVALVLIMIIGAVTVGGMLLEKYSYSEERADLNAYFHVGEGEVAIILQDEMLEEKAIKRDGVCYFDIHTVHTYFNDTFYIDMEEGIVLFTNAIDTVRTNIGEAGYVQEGQYMELPYVPAIAEGETLYLAADYVKLFTNMEYYVYEGRMQVYNEWGTREVDVAKKDTAVRVKGGIKSSILCDLPKGTEVEVLERMETWCKVKTQDAFIGYVENKVLEHGSEGQGVAYQETPVTDYVEPEYTTKQLDGKVCLGWHNIGGIRGNDTLDSMIARTKDMNVIAPTWFSLSDNEGNFESFGERAYVNRAHEKGLQVWGVLDDFNYHNTHERDIDVYEVLSATATRTKLISNVIVEAKRLGLDGINVDFERVNTDAGVHFAQFIRELSVQCRLQELTLSVDNYVPFNFNEYMRRDVQGKVCDYVIIMGYDEHWAGSGDPGSVASIGYVQRGIQKTKEQVPADKVVNGLPFYSILWQTKGAKVTDEYLTLANTADFIARIGQEGVWDEETQQQYFEWTSGATTYQLWAETEESIMVKLNVMRAEEIAGVAVWRLGYGTPKVWEMISAYVNS